MVSEICVIEIKGPVPERVELPMSIFAAQHLIRELMSETVV